MFLAAAERLGCTLSQCIVFGDTVWDQLAARRASMIGIGLLTGGYTKDELHWAGAYRVYQDPADLMRHLGEITIPAKVE